MIGHPAFQLAPRLGQFARDGLWEAAWAFDPDSPPGDAALRDYLQGAGEVAFEAFFGEAFFGVRRRGEPAELAAFARACVTALRGSGDAPAFLAALTRRTGLGGWGRAIAFAEVGAVNAWRSVGPFRMPAAREALAQFEPLWQALGATPLARHAQHRKAVEFACEEPLPHWFALPVSSPQPPFALERQLLLGALQAAA